MIPKQYKKLTYVKYYSKDKVKEFLDFYRIEIKYLKNNIQNAWYNLQDIYNSELKLSTRIKNKNIKNIQGYFKKELKKI